MQPFHRHLNSALVLLLAAAGLEAADVDSVPWHTGDVFVAAGAGSYKVFDRQGRLKTTLGSERGGFTTGCGFHPSLDRLYTTNFTLARVVAYDAGSSHRIVQRIDPAGTSAEGHSRSLAFDADGNLFVGHVDGHRRVHQYGDDGGLLKAFEVAVDGRGAEATELAADQTTLFYATGGRAIRRFDTVTMTQLPDFVSLAGSGYAFDLRLLPPGDGTGGLLVADGNQVKRLSPAGHVVQAYDDVGRDTWSALSLDPDGISFWAADSETDHVYRFHIESGRIEHHFQTGPGNTLFGLCVKGEPTAAVPRVAVMPAAYGLSQNTPNPFNPTTQIRYQLPQPGEVSLTVYNALGQMVRELDRGYRPSGHHQVIWDGTDERGRPVSSGVYVYRFVAEGQTYSRRMLLLK